MSKIITPTDSIHIEIDNLSNPPRVFMRTTGNISNIGAIGLMSQMIVELAKQIVIGGGSVPQFKPGEFPGKTEGNPEGGTQ